MLEVCQPDQSVINNCLEILQRCCQHSTEAAAKILDCSRLVDFVVKNYLPMVWHSDLPGIITLHCPVHSYSAE